MKKLIQRWLGITYINNSTVHKDIFWTEIDIINNKIKGIYNTMKLLGDRIESLEKGLNKHKDKYLNDLDELVSFDNKLDDRQIRLEQAFYETIDEDVSAEVQWNLVKGNKNDK